MNYTKPALSFEQQAGKLLQRGLQADRARLIETLSRVNYYRLSAYWHPFKRPDETFVPGTTLEKIWRRYTFDRHLRLLVMDGIERVEIAVLRTLMVEQHARLYGPFGYRHAKNFRPEFAGPDHQRMVDEFDLAASRSREPFVEHFTVKYCSEPGLPLWMAAEIASFGTLFTFYLDVIRSEFPTVTDFERQFVSLCFALATGVGKTRFMGAFITYLHQAHGIDKANGLWLHVRWHR